jgi:protein associated with RNAse G/E
MTKYFEAGDHILYQGIYENKVWYAQSMVVVKDTAEEIALAVYPGMECVAPRGYINGRHQWNRWNDYLSDHWDMQPYDWHTNRFLVLLYPEKYYSINLMWNHAEKRFLCYYINFQLPFRRTKLGFQTLDLEIDLVIDPDHSWHWKDVDDYNEGKALQIIRPEWVEQIESAKDDIFEKLQHKRYPLNKYWLNWEPDFNWSLPKLPQNWAETSI